MIAALPGTPPLCSHQNAPPASPARSRPDAVLKVLEAACDVLQPRGEMVVLIKPQFEAGKQQVRSGGGWGQVRVLKETGEGQGSLPEGRRCVVCWVEWPAQTRRALARSPAVRVVPETPERRAGWLGSAAAPLEHYTDSHRFAPPPSSSSAHPALQVSAGGVVRDPAVHREVIDRVVGACRDAGFRCAGWVESPIKGASAGNTEFLAYFQRGVAEEEGEGGRAAAEGADAAEQAGGAAEADSTGGSSGALQ